MSVLKEEEKAVGQTKRDSFPDTRNAYTKAWQSQRAWKVLGSRG